MWKHISTVAMTVDGAADIQALHPLATAHSAAWAKKHALGPDFDQDSESDPDSDASEDAIESEDG
jgi:hypothetical protein